MFVSRWGSAFAVTEQGPRGERLSIQIFDDAGDSVQKVYLEDADKRAAYDALVAAHRAEDQTPWQRVSGDQPAFGPSFHDAHVLPGHIYRYAVSAVDKQGHESGRSEEASETVPNQ